MPEDRVPVYQVRDWAEYFEIGKSAGVDTKSYQTFPNRQDGLGYIRLTKNTAEGERLYGCFVAMVITLGKQPARYRNGWLTADGTPTGEPYTASDLALMTRMTEEGMQAMLNRCSSKDIDWIVKHPGTGDPKPDAPEVPPDPPEPKKQPILSDDALSLCDCLSMKIRENDPKAKVPADFCYTTGWGRDARLLLETDGRPYDEALQVMNFASSDDFWKSNILSMGKFRKQYTKLLLQSKRRPNTPDGETAEEKAERQRQTYAATIEDYAKEYNGILYRIELGVVEKSCLDEFWRKVRDNFPKNADAAERAINKRAKELEKEG